MVDTTVLIRIDQSPAVIKVADWALGISSECVDWLVELHIPYTYHGVMESTGAYARKDCIGFLFYFANASDAMLFKLRWS